MSESPIFAKVYDLINWLLPATTKYSREYRFSLALPTQEDAFSLQRHLVAAAKVRNKRDTIDHLQQADVVLTMLRYKIRLARDLKLLKMNGYEHVSRLLDEVGRCRFCSYASS
ncbi:MAG: four helix bundle protein [Chloroflexi bacterium]|nr:four helix bundle protein [Chloroflexota bacterium]